MIGLVHYNSRDDGFFDQNDQRLKSRQLRQAHTANTPDAFELPSAEPCAGMHCMGGAKRLQT